MNKTLLIMLILLSSITATSQITKGNWMFGGSGGFSNRTSTLNETGEKSTLTRISIIPTAGYFLKNNFATGIRLRYAHSAWNYTGAQSTNIYGLGVFSRYYFLDFDKMYNFYSEIHYDHLYATSAGNESSNNFGVRIGHVIFLTSNVGLETFAEYEIGILEHLKYDTFSLGIGFQIHLENNN